MLAGNNFTKDFTAQVKAQIYLICKRVATTSADIKGIVPLVIKKKKDNME